MTTCLPIQLDALLLSSFSPGHHHHHRCYSCCCCCCYCYCYCHHHNRIRQYFTTSNLIQSLPSTIDNLKSIKIISSTPLLIFLSAATKNQFKKKNDILHSYFLKFYSFWNNCLIILIYTHTFYSNSPSYIIQSLKVPFIKFNIQYHTDTVLYSLIITINNLSSHCSTA